MLETFINEATIIYNNINYDYSKVDYKNCDTKIIIGCPKDNHGYFERVPYNFLRRKLGCPKCIKEEKDIENKKNINAKFINDANKVHNNKYDYSKVDFKLLKDKITIICKISGHSEFSQSVSSHLGGAGCPKCAHIKIAESKLKDINWFKKRAYEVHGDKYDYTDSIYVNSKSYINIKCKKEGHLIFSQKANNHLQGSGCPKCSIEESIIRQRLSINDFLSKLSTDQKELYVYDKVIYVSTHTHIDIKCIKCNKYFSQTPANHIRGSGCPKCNKEKVAIGQTFTTEQFIEKANNIHLSKYLYNKVNYINSQTYVIITCTVHGDYKQIPNSHLKGYGCNKCAIELNSQKQKFSNEQFIKKCLEIPGNSNKYDYTNTVYTKMNEKVKIICKICSNEFEQYANNHLNKQFGCGMCAGNSILTTEGFINKAILIHPDNRFDYSFTNYVRSNIPVKIICNTTKLWFEQTPNSHLSGSECPCCKPKYSRIQIEYLEFIKVTTPTIKYILNNGEYRIPNSRYHADGYIEDTKTIFEFHGCYWHGCPKCFHSEKINKTVKCSFKELYDKTMRKKKYCIDNGYNYLEIWECQWYQAKKAVMYIQRQFRKYRSYILKDI